MKSALTNACTLKLENFEGPFDLLFYLIEKNKIDIYDIPILIITEQYLDYLNAMQELDLEIASEFWSWHPLCFISNPGCFCPRRDLWLKKLWIPGRIDYKTFRV